MPDVSRCGRCGRVYKRPDNARYTNLCPTCKVPHQLVSRQPGDQWRCDYCGQVGSEGQLQGTDCTHVYAPCEVCGEAPYCAPDCAGVAEAMSAPGVYVAGFGPKPKH